MRREFERCTPEEVGIPSEAIADFLDELEYRGFTQMHGLMIMRAGKVCAEGWWSPFAPGLRHCDHSLSKTYTATAVGIARREGLLRLDDRVAVLLADRAPAHPGERLSRMTVRDLLVMGAGSEPADGGYPADWIERFFARPILDGPGEVWRYDSQATTLLSAVVERVSGVSMLEYLRPRLFEKIGIDASNVLCNRTDDGVCIGGSGMFTTTEDNLRLMKLYLDGGVWDGERILDEEFVREATTCRMDTRAAHSHTPWIYDNCVGYGYQIWMCRYPGAYRADGAFGQFSVVLPDLDMIVSINEDAYLGENMTHAGLRLLRGKLGEDRPVHGPQATLNALFDVLIPRVASGPLPPSPASARLQKRLERLCVPRCAPAATAYPRRAPERAIEAPDGKVSFGLLFGMAKNRRAYRGAERIRFSLCGDDLLIEFDEGGEAQRLIAALDGGRRDGVLRYEGLNETRVSASAWWAAQDRLCLSLLWTETEAENRFSFTFDADGATVEKWVEGGVFGPVGVERARYRFA